MASSSPNMVSASALHSSVLPTPVGPRNRNEPIGRFGSFRPTRLRRMALATAVTASSCPTTRLCSVSSRREQSACSRPRSGCVTGIPVQPATTLAMSSGDLALLRVRRKALRSSSRARCPPAACTSAPRRAAARPSQSPARRWPSAFSRLQGVDLLLQALEHQATCSRRCMRTWRAASSIRSMALSGRKRSVI